MSYRLDPQWEDHEIEPDYGGNRWRGHLYKALISVGVLTAFGAAVLYAYSEGAPAGDKAAKPGSVPLVKAETAPVKEKPEDPGGVKVPHRDRDIYRKLDLGTDKAAKPDPEAKAERKQARRVPPRPQTYEDILKPKKGDKLEARPTPKPAERKTGRVEPETRRIDMTPKARTPGADAEKRDGKIAALPRLRGGRSGDSERQVADLSPRAGTRVVPKVRPDTRTRDRDADTAGDRRRDREGVQPASAVGPYRVQLGAFRTPHKAQYEWKTLSRKNKDVLGSLRMVIERVNLGPKGVYYRLQVGPLKTEPAARGLCRTLGKRKVNCIPVNG